MDIYLAPHLPCQENHLKITAGRTHSGVSDQGKKLTRFLRVEQPNGSSFAAIVHSGLPRSVETLKLCLHNSSVPVIQDERLTAIDYGTFQGKSMAEIRSMQDIYLTKPFPGGESFQQMADRYLHLLEDLYRKFVNQKILLIAHNATFPILLHLCLRMPLAEAFTFTDQHTKRLHDGSMENFYARAPYGPLQYEPQQAATQRVIVVAQHKSGTNLISRLLSKLGFTPVGLGIQNSYFQLAIQLQRRWGSKLAFENPAKLFSVLMQNYPGKRSLFFHHLPQGEYLQEWHESQQPPIIYHYRDPRAVIVSLIHYLTTPKHTEQMPKHPWVLLHSVQLEQLPTMENKIKYVLQCMPDYLNVFRTHAWLLNNQNVCTTSYEELVGEKGGGSRQQQRAAVMRILKHLAIDNINVEQLINELYHEQARTFREGKVNAWKSEFSSLLLEQFNQEYGDILNLYNY